MTMVIQAVWLMITAMTVENLLFTRAIGVQKKLISSKNAPETIIIGILLTIITASSCCIAAVIRPFAETLSYWFLIEPAAYFTVVAVLDFLVYLITRFLLHGEKLVSEFFFRKLMIASFNSAVFGAILLCTRRLLTPLDGLFFGLGCGLGVLIGIALLGAQKRQLRLARVPAAFRGLPITLIYLGILSLALYGLIGHQLMD